MTRTISLREANQGFARCVRDVEAGDDYVITRNGKPVARLVPVAGARVLSPEQEAALARTDARTQAGWPIGAGPSIGTTCMVDERFTIDTNILVYSVDSQGGGAIPWRSR